MDYQKKLFLLKQFYNLLNSLSVLTEFFTEEGQIDHGKDYGEMLLCVKEDMEQLEDTMTQAQIDMVIKNVRPGS